MWVPWIAVLLAFTATAQQSGPEHDLLSAVRASPSAFEANHRLAQYYLQQNRVADALPYLETAAKSSPGHPAAVHDLALARLTLGRPEEACNGLRAALRQKEEASWLNLLGVCAAELRQPVEAAKAFHRAAQLDPSEKHLFDLGDFLVRHDQPGEAIRMFEYAVSQHPASPRLRVGLGVAYYSNGSYPEAVKALCEAVDLDPADPRALDFLGQMHGVSLELAAEISDRLAGFVERYPNNARAHHYYGLSLWNRRQGAGASETAESHLRRATELDSTYADAFLQLGILLEDTGRGPEAIAALARAAQLDPALKTAHFRLIRLYLQNGNKDLAAAHKAAFERLRGAEPAGRRQQPDP